MQIIMMITSFAFTPYRFPMLDLSNDQHSPDLLYAVYQQVIKTVT
jgi:hypothetical protein